MEEIAADKDRLDLVLELQRFLIRRITQVERRIIRVSMASAKMKRSLSRDRLAKASAKHIKVRIKDCSDLVQDLRHMMFLWRCFGDGIAAAYQSKYALKHLYFDSNYGVKESPGFMTGKAGFRREWRLLKLGIKMGVPVVLADLTNIIRHGDLCALAGADPLLIEVKSSKNQNARTARQMDQLNELASFYANDGAEAFRGLGPVQRMAQKTAERNHEAVANACVTEALAHGFATVEPEPGLRYIALTCQDLNERATNYFSPTIQPYGLLPSTNWLPAYPFTLSLKPGNLVRFFLGEVMILVLIDLAYLKGLYTRFGVHATILMNGCHAVQFCIDPTDLYQGVFRVSEQMFGRIAGEFQSLAWFAEETARSITDNVPEFLSNGVFDEFQLQSGTLRKIPEDWYNVRDCFDKN